MVLEVAILEVKKGMVSKFEADFRRAEPLISSIEGYLNHRLKKCLENDHKFILLVEWESLEAHTEGFRKSDQYLTWKKLLHHYYDPFPVVEHYVS
ncbi:antibiotic biosynthesis monooxygenase family protein [Portibacter lacus]|uniref:ABM domain-containing protein n=1 Tax=Portibacter lacus TaxID=1099794 RepID=A0AA37SM05_9BACT|nr:antibiotic biosynthesis monooxygenase [Portibacter lacus]GLR15519.1 hypothetical protein GCM10007940_01340 [Portibacter lacus]